MGERHQYILIRGFDEHSGRELLENCVASANSQLIEGKSPDYYRKPWLGFGTGKGCVAILLERWHVAYNEIGRLTNQPWIQLRAQEGSHWDYTLLCGAQILDQFSTEPNYWESDDPYDSKYSHLKGNASVLANAWELPEERVDKYLVNWEWFPDEPGPRIPKVKAYASDVSAYCDVLQVDDVARALGCPVRSQLRDFYIDLIHSK